MFRAHTVGQRRWARRSLASGLADLHRSNALVAPALPVFDESNRFRQFGIGLFIDRKKGVTKDRRRIASIQDGVSYEVSQTVLVETLITDEELV